MDCWFPDTTVLRNFAAVDRLDLLESLLRGRGRWVEAIAAEVADASGTHPNLRSIAIGGWLGDPIEVADPTLIASIERVRRAAFGGASSNPRQHLGESQTLILIKQGGDYSGSWWITDDKLAASTHNNRTSSPAPPSIS